MASRLSIREIRRGEVFAVIPEYGSVRLPLSELLQDENGARVLLLSPGRDAQRRKLGLSWFYPQIRKYRRSLIEVLWHLLSYNCLTWPSL